MPTYDTDAHGQNLGPTFPSSDDPLLQKLRGVTSFKLAPDMSEIAKASFIIGYAHNLFTHDGIGAPSANDPLTILLEAKAGKSFSCAEYSLLANGLLWAYGIPSRVVGLKTSDVETREYGAGHVIVEFWSHDLQKWVMSDVQAGLFADSDFMLLSAFELGQAIHESKNIEYSAVSGSNFDQDKPYDDMPSYTEWIREYHYFYDTPAHPNFEDKDRSKEQITMLVPVGVAPPKKFQNAFAMNVIYTTSVQDFYRKPL